VGDKSTLVFVGDNFISLLNPTFDKDESERALLCAGAAILAWVSLCWDGFFKRI
jgi:hypothetical protein